MFFFRNQAENVIGRLVQDLSFFSKKALDEVKVRGLQLSFNILRKPITWYTIKTLQTLQNLIPSYLQFRNFGK